MEIICSKWKCKGRKNIMDSKLKIGWNKFIERRWPTNSNYFYYIISLVYIVYRKKLNQIIIAIFL